MEAKMRERNTLFLRYSKLLVNLVVSFHERERRNYCDVNWNFSRSNRKRG